MSKGASETAPDAGELASILFRDRHHLVFAERRIFGAIWRFETQAAAVERVSRLLDEHVKTLSPRLCCLLNVVEETAHVPSAEARAGLQAVLRKNAPHLLRSAVVYEGSGFKAAAVFGVATSLAALTRHPFPHKVFSALGQATDWFAQALNGELGEAESGPALADVVRGLRG